MAAPIAVAGLIGWTLFAVMDQYWYHDFLRAASRQAAKIEERWQERVPELGLARRITEESTNVPVFRGWFGTWDSTGLLGLFYFLGDLVFVVVAVVAFFATG